MALQIERSRERERDSSCSAALSALFSHPISLSLSLLLCPRCDVEVGALDTQRGQMDGQERGGEGRGSRMREDFAMSLE